MYARVLYQHVSRLCHPSQALFRTVSWAQHQHRTVASGNEEEKGRDVLLLPQRSDVGYMLQYNPSSYQHLQHEPGMPLSRIEVEEEAEQTRLIPPFRQQSNHYSVNSSRHLSCSKNTLLDLALNRSSAGRKAGNNSQYPTEASTPDPKGNPRAFQKCRPEYAPMTLDLSQRPTPIQSKQAFDLLHKVTVLKGSMEPADVTDFLCKLSQLHQDQTPLVRGDTRFTMLLRYAVETLPYFTHTQLLDILESFVWLGLPSTHSMLGLYESELALRAEEMTVHQLLLAADLWRILKRPVPQYLQRLFHCINLNLKHVGVPELVQLLYVMGEGRWCPKELINPIEQLLVKYVDVLESEELGVVCLGLFKSQTSLSVGVVNRLVDKAVSVVTDMSDFALVNVMKLLRFSYLDHRAWLEAMEKEVPSRTPGMGIQGLMHVALACSALHYRNDHILFAIAERLPFLASHCRSKDAAKLLWAFGTLGVQPSQCPSLYPSLIDALRQKEAEFQRYPEQLLTGLLGLAFVCEFPEDLLALALSPEFVSLAIRSKKLDLKKDLFTLDGTVAVEFTDWTGPRLSRQLKEEVEEMLWNFAQSDVCQKNEVLEAERFLGELLGGEEFVKKRMILPHTRSIDLEVHLDSAGKPVVLATSNRTSSLERSTPSSKSSADWERISTGVVITEDLLAQLTNKKKYKLPKPVSAQSFPLRRMEPDERGPLRRMEPDERGPLRRMEPDERGPLRRMEPDERGPLRRMEPDERGPLRRMEPDERGRLFSIGVELSDGLVESLTKPASVSSSSRDFSLPEGTPVKLAIQVSNRNHYCYHSRQLLGLHSMKRRQLELVGYRVVELPHWEWFPLLRKSRAEKLAYLHCKVFSRLD